MIPVILTLYPYIAINFIVMNLSFNLKRKIWSSNTYVWCIKGTVIILHCFDVCSYTAWLARIENFRILGVPPSSPVELFGSFGSRQHFHRTFWTPGLFLPWTWCGFIVAGHQWWNMWGCCALVAASCLLCQCANCVAIGGGERQPRPWCSCITEENAAFPSQRTEARTSRTAL